VEFWSHGPKAEEQLIVEIRRAGKHGEGVYRRRQPTELPIDSCGGATWPVPDQSSAYGKVNVNTAPAGEIAQILGLSQKEADAIVKFRKDHGKFEDFDALGKVPGVDPKKLEKSREAIAY